MKEILTRNKRQTKLQLNAIKTLIKLMTRANFAYNQLGLKLYLKIG